MKKGKKDTLSKSMAGLSDEEMNAVTGGFETFPDKDGIDRHSWFVTLMMNLFPASDTHSDSSSDKR